MQAEPKLYPIIQGTTSYVSPMPGNHIRIFLSSPNDVAAEREKMADLVAEINDVLTYLAPERGLKLELLRYEIDAYPDYGAPQAVVDRLLPDDFDIFIGRWHPLRRR